MIKQNESCMAGIAGIIAKSCCKNNALQEIDFNLFTRPLKINKSRQHALVNYNNDFLFFVSDIGDPVKRAKFRQIENLSVFINGNVFINEDQLSLLVSKFNIPNTHDDEFYLPYLWKLYGKKMTQKITGDFVIAVFDKETCNFYCFNSRFGMLPLYYAYYKGCVLFSSRLESFRNIFATDLKFNHNAILDYLLFNYPLGNITFLQKVNNLQSGGYIEKRYQDSEINTGKYWDVDNLFTGKLLNKHDSVELIDNAMTQVVKKMTRRMPEIYSALTGGWDGRLLLTYILGNENKQKFFFSFGRNGFKDIEIPKEMCEKFDLNYFSIPLEGIFEDNFIKWANETVLLSDALRSIKRSHYTYAASVLGKNTDYFLSGNCASNLMKIVSSPCPAYNSNIFKLFNSGDLHGTVRDLYNEIKEDNILQKLPDFENYLSHINDVIENTQDKKSGENFYKFLLNEAERKYFGAEVASYSSYVHNLMPFIDFDFVSAISKTPFFGGHYKFNEQSYFTRQKLIKLYAHLMTKKNKAIADHPTDRGFPITTFLSWHGLILGYYLKKKKYKKINSINDPYVLAKGENQICNINYLNNNIFTDFAKNIPDVSDEKCKNIFSISLWLNGIKD